MSENPFTDGQQFSAARLNSMYNAHQNEGVLSGLGASTSTNAFDVDVASGNVFLNGTNVSVGATTVSHSTPDPEDRIDLLSVDSTGTVNITQGSPAATSGQPVAPDIPTDEILISLVYVRAGSSEILTGDIFNDYQVTLATDIPAFESPQGDFTDATVANPPSNATDVVRQTELVSGNPHADSAAVGDLPRMEGYSDSTSIGGPDTKTYFSVSFSSDAYVHSYQLSFNSRNSTDGTGISSIIQTDNFSDSIGGSYDASGTKSGFGKDFSPTSSLEFVATADDGTANDSPGFGDVSASVTVLVFP